jgi:nitrite reductase (cytochrome c-552)
VAPAVFAAAGVAAALLGLLAVSIMERRWEAQRPIMVAQPVGEWETDPEVWGANYPREYESWKRTEDSSTRTLFGGSYPRDYLEEDPMQVILFAGYGFSKDYVQARGHAHAARDVLETARTDSTTVATCWTCKSPNVPKLMHEIGVKQFYRSNFMELKDQMLYPISCLDCHDPGNTRLRISRPALVEAFERQDRDVRKATHQETRSLVCAQCHVEYYFRDGYELTFPWDRGTSVEAMIEYFDARDFRDWVHPISQTPIIKAQHPDYELWLTGVHAYRNVSCADCHMPYRSEGGVKYSDHHVQSPLLDISNSCAVCHRWSEQEVRARVEAIQTKVQNAMLAAERALVQAHFDVAAAVQAGVDDLRLAEPRKLLRHAQFRWDFVSASNGMGFHSPQESMRILGDSANQAQQVRVQTARLLAAQGVSSEPDYPDVSTRGKAWEVAQAFVKGTPPRLVGGDM